MHKEESIVTKYDNDFNNIPKVHGEYHVSEISANTSNLPFGSLRGSALVVVFGDGNYIYQIVIDSGKYCYRKYWGSIWTAWYILG